MAKQTGLHQIRGKVGEHSYYRQSGVSSGLIRGINPGMSSRVKTSPEYANTRLNNKEFKTASRMAASMIDGIVPRLRPMFNTFRNARLSAGLLEVIKGHSGVWGNRSIGVSDRAAACVVANKLAKNKFSDLLNVTLGDYDTENETQRFNVAGSSTAVDVLQSMGATGLKYEIRHVQVYEGVPTADEGARLENIVVLGPTTETSTNIEDFPIDVQDNVDRLSADLTILSGRIYLSFYVIVAMPYRTVGSTDHILQEGCTFEYFVDPEQEA